MIKDCIMLLEIEHVRVVENNQEADTLCAGIFLSGSACMCRVAVGFRPTHKPETLNPKPQPVPTQNILYLPLQLPGKQLGKHPVSCFL